MRLWRFVRDCRSAGDREAMILAAVIASIVCWLVLLPLWPALQRATIARFHLATSSFWLWSLEQAIPAMYNLENRYWIEEPDGREVRSSGYLNHFPTRVVTFGDGRIRWLAIPADAKAGSVSLEIRPGRLRIESRYQGEVLESEFDVGEDREVPHGLILTRRARRQ